MSTAQESGSWLRGYDAYGNPWVQSANHTLSFATPTAQSQFDAASNRLTKTFDGTALLGNAYDAAGNLTNHPWVGAMAYDAENHQTSFTGASGTATYQYDGDGRRVKKLQGSRTTVFVYDAFGNLAAEYDTQPAPNLMAGTYYRTTDHLGSTRLVTDGNGAVVSRRDLFPFGEEIPANATFANCQLVTDGGAATTYNQEFGVYQKFTGKERDTESGLDYFGARYMSSAQGRFTSPDPLFFQKEMLVDPQRWNLYAYVRDNPLRLVDPTGERIELTGETEEERKRQLAAIQEAVGREAGARLNIQEDKKTGQFFVGITGDVSTFRDLNPVASTFATMITLDEVAKFHIVASKERMEMGDGKEWTLSGLGGAGGATARDINGQLHVFVQRPEEGYGFSLSGEPWWWPFLRQNLGTVTGHEFGHALEHMFYRLLGQVPSKQQVNRGALILENKVRRLQKGPDAAIAIKH